MLHENQIPKTLNELFSERESLFGKGASVTQVNSIPDTNQIPIENPRHWLKIPNVVCVFVDMKNSTELSASAHDNSTAATYQLYTGTAVKLFGYFEAPYIDVRGDGVLALFDSDQAHRALAAAVSFKTFANEIFVKKVKGRTGIEVGSHCGIDQKTVLVRKVGYKRYRGRSDRQNEVWAGKPVNMAAKLSSLSESNEILASERFYKSLKDEKAIWTCGCGALMSSKLWSEIDLEEDDRFDFELAYSLRSNWCQNHGKEYCEALLKADE